MTTHEFLLSNESRRRLAALIGAHWECFGAASMGPQLFAPFDVFFVTDRATVTVVSTVDFFDIDGDAYDTTIAELSVDSGAAQLNEASARGGVYVFHAGEVVLDVLAVRDVLSEIRDGQQTWTLAKDVGVVFVLTTGAIAISQDSIHDELLVISMAASLDAIALPEIQRKWHSKLGIEYVEGRQFLSVVHDLGA